VTKTERKSLRLTADTVRQAEELAGLWHGNLPSVVKSLSLADVVATCVARIHERETKMKEKRR